MKVIMGKCETPLEVHLVGDPPELEPSGSGNLSFPAPGIGLCLIEATDAEREALALAGYRLRRATDTVQ